MSTTTIRSGGTRWIKDWNPDDPTLWKSAGRGMARRNLLWSIVAEHVGFSVWFALEVARRESAAVLGFTSAIGACGGYLIPRSFGASIHATGNAEAALLGFLGFYMTCIAMTWWFYARRTAPVIQDAASRSLAHGRI